MKLLTVIALAAASLASANAATISLSGGFGVGIIVTTNGVNSAYSLEVGNYASNIFTAFAAPTVNQAAGAKIAGSFVGSGPIELNTKAIFVRVTTSAGTAILSTPSGEVFPDLSSALSSNSVTMSSSSSGSVVNFTGATNVTFSDANHLNFVTVPEPSAALLGAIGALGLLRRRRI